MGAITAVSRLLGFGRVLVVAAVLGTTYLGNAFQAANSFSNVLFELLAAGALSAVLVPVFVELLDRDDQAGAEQVAGGVLGLALLGLGVVTVVGVVAAPLVARLLTPGVPDATAAEQRELIAHLLRFFVPQVLLYAAGAVATAVLYARRRFAVTALAPIGNTVVTIASLLALRAVADGPLGLDVAGGERWLLVVAGSGGVVAFVGILLVACERSGFRLRPRLPRGDARVWSAVRRSGWGVVLHTGAGVLQGAAVIGGAAVAGGVVAYQIGWVFFLAPYAVLAQPIHTAILPELVVEAGEPPVFASSVRWSLERMALLVLPVAAGLLALAGPGMRLVSFGESGEAGADLLRAALCGLAVGLFPYGAFLLLARAFYALGDSRFPGLVALGSSAGGALVVAVGAPMTDGSARVVLLGAAHSAAYAVGALVLGVTLARRLGSRVRPVAAGRMAMVSIAAGLVSWRVAEALSGTDPSRASDLVALVAAGAVGTLGVLGGYRATAVGPALTVRLPRVAP
ncbi:MAG: murein biosynthesis integral membrane protein MurJ [Acidimicrobiia bacterium]